MSISSGASERAWVSATERPEQIFEELARHRDADPACADLLQYRRMATAHQYLRLYDLVRRYLPAGSEVLDWGCGNGHASYGLQRSGYRVTGFSFEDFGLRRHLGADYRFVQGDPAEPATLPFAAESFDAAVSVGVLEHVRETGGDEAASLREIVRTLRPGGLFICYHFPNRFSLIEAMTRRIPGKHSHRYRYTGEDILRLCREAGLEVVALGRYGALPRNFWHRTPGSVGNSRAVARGWDLLDSGLGTLLSPICQNYYFVARKGSR